MLLIIAGFASIRSALDCRAIIEQYAERGGGGGVTRAAMRVACNLTPLSKRKTEDEAVPGTQTARVYVGVASSNVVHQSQSCSDAAQPPTSQMVGAETMGARSLPVFSPPASDDVTVETMDARSVPVFLRSEEDAGMVHHVKLLQHCLQHGKDLFSEAELKRLPQEVWPGVRPSGRLGVWRKLVSAAWWKPLPARGKVKTPFIPRIPFERGILTLLPDSRRRDCRRSRKHCINEEPHDHA